MQTWYRWNNLNISSQIDFILTRIGQRRNVTNGRTISNVTLDTDHCPVMLTLRESVQKPTKSKSQASNQINYRKLR